MAEEVKDVTTASEQPERTFTQSEVNAIIGDRLAQERKKYADYNELKSKAAKFDEAEEASKTELQKATEQRDAFKAELDNMKKANSLRELREKVATEKGIPANLLTAETEEDCNAQADAILSFAKPNAYPTVKDSGEVRNTGKRGTKEQFADWFNEAI